LKLKAVIMAGGKGSRLYPLTSNMPKPLVPIVNKPLLMHILELLKKYGFTEIFITVNTLSEQIAAVIGDGNQFGVQIHYKWEETPLGTAGGLKNFEEELTEPFLVISGDILTDIDLSKLKNFHKKHNGIATLTLTQADEPIDYAIVTLDETQRVSRFLEKPSWEDLFSDIINAGIYILDPAIFEYLEKNRPFDFSMQLFPLLLEKGVSIYGYFTKKYWQDIGVPSRYIQTNYDVFTQNVDIIIPGKEIEKNFWVGEGTLIDSEATIYPPAILGQNCKVQKGVVIDQMSIIGHGVRIGAFSTIRRAIIWNDVTIGERVQLNHCVIASRVTVGATSLIETNAIIGADSTIGNTCIIKPSILISPNQKIKSSSTIDKDIG